ncbi:hypothetical protein VNO80_10265 [Phaseolus coccineus]|uniref:Uncharacterized protein n=1 Tax=Phaseolus coccineus TaxID=3886 RepID=A0AAN9RDA7_PHACN
MGSCEYHRLHIFFFPFLAHGHMTPTVDMAKSFAEKGVKATIITTPLNAPFIFKAIGKSKTNGNDIHIQTIQFPSAEAGLPDGCENVDSIPSPDLFQAFCLATGLLQEKLEQLLLRQRPNCIFFLSLCATTCANLYEPYKDVSSDSELFLVPNLPGEIKMTRMQLPPFIMSKEKTGLVKLLEEAKESEERSYGVVVNSFYELEKVYADHFKKVLGRKAWHIGPLSLCNKDAEEKAHRGKEACIDELEKAPKRILTGEEAIDMKNKAKGLSQLAKRAVLGGGSSYSNLNALIQELSSLSL